MNNSSLMSNNNNNNTNNNHDKNDNTEENLSDMLDIIFDYTSNRHDESTLGNGHNSEISSKNESTSNLRRRSAGRTFDTDARGLSLKNDAAAASSHLNLRIIDFNDITIGDTIGVGGFGHVFHGKYGDIDVAIKTAKSLTSFCSIPTAVYDDKSDNVQRTLIDSLLREARLFSNLKHRNIIQLFGVSPSLSTKSLYLVMEYAHGGALNFLLRRRQSGLYPNVFIHYAKQIADGMKYLHEEAPEHIIHRDLKCSNILILEHIIDIYNDSDLLHKTLKITDFGLARKQLQSSNVSTAGTFAWMSPECIRNTEFSTKSDVWSFGVLLWECLTGEVPYEGFDQVQVAFGIATNKYSLPIPSTCPEEFTQLMIDCWKISPDERPTFCMLLEQINKIIDTNYKINEINHMEPNEESYQSLQKDWRLEIQDMFNELKEKEQEIRDREQAIHQRLLEQNYQRLQLEKWEQQLYEREMHIVELELQLLIAKNNQERTYHPTPKLQNRSGGFIRSILNGNNLTAHPGTSISSPTNFRHLISVCHNQPNIDHATSSNIPPPSPSFAKPVNSINKLTNMQFNHSYSSSSTPSTPNMSRLRTLTFNQLDDEYNSSALPDKPPRSMSQTKSSGRKSKSSTIKRICGRTNVHNGESKWYLETSTAGNTNNNNNNDHTNLSSTKSTPVGDRPSRKLENSDELSSSSSSLCSTPNDRSLARALFSINSMLASIGLGHRVPAQVDPGSIRTPQCPQTIPRSVNESIQPKCRKYTSSASSSFDETQKQYDHINTDNRPEPCYLPVRPNSLILLSPSTHNSSQKSHALLSSTENRPLTDDDNEKYYSAQSSKISTPMVHSMDLYYSKNNIDDKVMLTSIIDVVNEDQKSHPTKVLSPKNEYNRKSNSSHHVFEKDVLH